MPRLTPTSALAAVLLPLSVLASLCLVTVCTAADGPPGPADKTAPATGPSTRPATGPADPAAGGVRKITLDEFDHMRAQKDAIIIDVRTPQEFAAGHVPGAVNIPVSGAGSDAFADQIKLLDKDKTYLVHCARGGRSAIAVSKMEKAGLKNLNDFSGGMEAWRKAKKPVESGGGK